MAGRIRPLETFSIIEEGAGHVKTAAAKPQTFPVFSKLFIRLGPLLPPIERAQSEMKGPPPARRITPVYS
ncbi:protein of unknown function [Candidatus Promineifilum breve]|uniref:Uncharacterized protein n=1 Tax=Candidatus Promineifilum breve TaxID=1806508 RepID=A0A160T4J6_9CHLR|nr:protein of unknown function [Candidatus Promineifilum breve]